LAECAALLPLGIERGGIQGRPGTRGAVCLLTPSGARISSTIEAEERAFPVAQRLASDTPSESE